MIRSMINSLGSVAKATDEVKLNMGNLVDMFRQGEANIKTTIETVITVAKQSPLRGGNQQDDLGTRLQDEPSSP